MTIVTSNAKVFHDESILVACKLFTLYLHLVDFDLFDQFPHCCDHAWQTDDVTDTRTQMGDVSAQHAQVDCPELKPPLLGSFFRQRGYETKIYVLTAPRPEIARKAIRAIVRFE